MPISSAARGSASTQPAGALRACRRNERARAFLAAFRQSQMYEQFVQERLAVAAAGGWDDTGGCSAAERVGCCGVHEVYRHQSQLASMQWARLPALVLQHCCMLTA